MKKITLDINRPSFDEIITFIDEKGMGLSSYRDPYYVFAEGWDHICVSDQCTMEDPEEFENCARDVALEATYEQIPNELKNKGFDVLEIDVIDEGWHPFGTTIALLQKSPQICSNINNGKAFLKHATLNHASDTMCGNIHGTFTPYKNITSPINPSKQLCLTPTNINWKTSDSIPSNICIPSSEYTKLVNFHLKKIKK